MPEAAVSGAPVADLDGVQNSSMVPHWPHMLQQEFNGHGLRSANCWSSMGGFVPDT